MPLSEDLRLLTQTPAFLESNDETRRAILEGHRDEFISENPAMADYANQEAEAAQVSYLRNTGQGRYVPDESFQYKAPWQSEDFAYLSEDEKENAIESFRKSIPEIAQRDSLNRKDVEFYLNQVSDAQLRKAKGEDTGWIADKAYRAFDGFAAGLASYVGADGIADSIRRSTAENPKYDRDISSALFQGAGDMAASTVVFLGASLGATALTGNPVVGGYAGTAATLGSNAIVRYNDAYRQGIELGLSEEASHDAGIAALPGAVIDALGDNLIAGKFLPTAAKATFVKGTLQEKQHLLAELIKEKSTRGRIIEAAKSAFVEGSSEALGDYAAGYGSYLATDEREYIPKDEDLAMSFGIGALLGGGVSLATEIPSMARGDKSKLEEVQNEVQRITDPSVETDEKAANKIYSLINEGNYKEALDLSRSVITQPRVAPEPEIKVNSDGKAEPTIEAQDQQEVPVSQFLPTNEQQDQTTILPEELTPAKDRVESELKQEKIQERRASQMPPEARSEFENSMERQFNIYSYDLGLLQDELDRGLRPETSQPIRGIRSGVAEDIPTLATSSEDFARVLSSQYSNIDLVRPGEKSRGKKADFAVVERTETEGDVNVQPSPELQTKVQEEIARGRDPKSITSIFPGNKADKEFLDRSGVDKININSIDGVEFGTYEDGGEEWAALNEDGVDNFADELDKKFGPNGWVLKDSQGFAGQGVVQTRKSLKERVASEGQMDLSGWYAEAYNPKIDLNNRQSGTDHRVHIVKRGGQMEVVPYATHNRLTPIPYIARTEDIRLMEDLALAEAEKVTDKVPENGLLGVDVVMGSDNNFHVTELNPTQYGQAALDYGVTGGSGYTGSAYIQSAIYSHIKGRVPAFAMAGRAILREKLHQQRMQEGAPKIASNISKIIGNAKDEFALKRELLLTYGERFADHTKDIWNAFTESLGQVTQKVIDTINRVIRTVLGKEDNFVPSQKNAVINESNKANGQVKAEEAAKTTAKNKQDEQESPATININFGQPKSSNKATKSAAFKTSKGSEYTLYSDGTSVRNKAERVEHPGDSGVKPKSTTTFFVTKEGADSLGIVQTNGIGFNLEQISEDQWAARALSGPYINKFYKTSIAYISNEPQVGMYPVEIWNTKQGQEVHFGNEITEIIPLTKEEVSSAIGEFSTHNNTEVISDPNERWAGKTDRDKIILNAANINSTENAREVFTEEAVHSVWEDTEIKDAWNNIISDVTPSDIRTAQERYRKVGIEISPEAAKEEAAVSLVLSRYKETNGKVRSFIDALWNKLKETFGLSQPDNLDDASRIVHRALAYQMDLQAKYKLPGPIQQTGEWRYNIPNDKKSKKKQLKQLLDLKRIKINDRFDTNTNELAKVIRNVRPSEVKHLTEDQQERFWQLIDNIHQARVENTQNPQLRNDYRKTISELNQYIGLIDNAAMQDMLKKYDHLDLSELQSFIDEGDRTGFTDALNQLLEADADFQEKKKNRDKKDKERYSKKLENWRDLHRQAREDIKSQYANAEEYIAAFEDEQGAKITGDRLRQFLMMHYDYHMDIANVDELEGKELFRHVFAINNLLDGNFMYGAQTTAKYIAGLKNSEININSLKKKFRDPIINQGHGFLGGLDEASSKTETAQTRLERWSPFIEAKEWLQNDLMGDFFHGITIEAKNNEELALRDYQTLKKSFEETLGREMNSEDRVAMSIVSRLIQYKAGEDGNKAFLANMKNEEKAIQNVIGGIDADGNPIDGGGTAAQQSDYNNVIVPIYRQLVAGLEDSTKPLEDFMANLNTRLGLGDEKVGSERRNLLSEMQNIMDRFYLDNKVVSESFYNKPFTGYVNYMPRAAMAFNPEQANVRNIELDADVNAFDQMHYQSNSILSEPSQLKQRNGIGNNGHYSNNIEYVFSRGVHVSSLTSSTTVPRFVLNHQLKSDTVRNLINGSNSTYRVDQLQQWARTLMLHAMHSGQPLGTIGVVMKALNENFARVALSGFHQGVTQTASGYADYHLRTGNISGAMNAARYFIQNREFCNDWFTKNAAWIAQRSYLGEQELDRRRAPSFDESKLLNSPWMKQLQKIHHKAGEIITFSLREGDDFTAKSLVMAEYARLVQQKYNQDGNFSGDTDFRKIMNDDIVGNLLSEAILNVEQNVNASNKVTRGEFFVDRHKGMSLIRNITTAFSSHVMMLAGQFNIAVRDLVDLHNQGGSNADKVRAIRTIGAILSQSFTFSSMRYVINGGLALAMIQMLRELFDDEDGKIAQLEENVRHAKLMGNDVATEHAENELKSAIAIRRQIDTFSQRQTSFSSYWKNAVKDELGSIHFLFNGPQLPQKLVFPVFDVFGEHLAKEDNDARVAKMEAKIKALKTAGNFRQASKLSEDLVLLKNADYLPWNIDTHGNIGVGGITGTALDAVYSSWKEVVNSMAGADEININDFILSAQSAGMGQADLNRFFKTIDRIEDEQFRNQKERDENKEKRKNQLKQERLAQQQAIEESQLLDEYTR